MKKLRKGISLLLVLLMGFGLLPVMAQGAETTEESWLWPVAGVYGIGSNYGLRDLDEDGVLEDTHQGIDINNYGSKNGKAFGQPVRAAKSGIVYSSVSSFGDSEHESNSFGNCVRIDHGDGTYSLYAHMRQTGVRGLGYVAQGEVIGYIGDSGSSSGAHLHFQIYTDKNNYSGSCLNTMPTNSNISILHRYKVPAGWSSKKITYIFGVPGDHTCNQTTYQWYKTAHPHNSCFKCSVCGSINEAADQPNYVENCEICTPDPSDLGGDFYAVIQHAALGQFVTKADDHRIRLEEENGDASQLWRFERQDDGSYLISSTVDGQVLECRSGDAEQAEKPAARKTDEDTVAQQWFLYEYEDGLILQSQGEEALNLVLDLSGETAGDEIEVVTKERSNRENQLWTVCMSDNVQLKAPSLNVSVGNSLMNTAFFWEEVCGETEYDLTIWKVDEDGKRLYCSKQAVNSGQSVRLPEGRYQACVEAVNCFEVQSSELQTFIVAAFDMQRTAQKAARGQSEPDLAGNDGAACSGLFVDKGGSSFYNTVYGQYILQKYVPRP